MVPHFHSRGRSTGSLTTAGLLIAIAAAPAAASTVVLDFDSLPAATIVTTQYPGVTFSSSPGFVNTTTAQAATLGTSPPNFICTGSSATNINCVQPTYIDFASRVQQLHFVGTGINSTGPVATVNIFVDFVMAASVSVIGAGNPNVAVPVDLTAYTNVTRIEITNINDPGGIGWDDFTFEDCAQATPYGSGCPTTSGHVPVLEFDCGIAAGNATFLSISDAPGGATAYVFFGLQAAALPMGAGCDLLIAPLLPLVLPIPLGGTGPGAGTAILAGAVPAGTTGVQFTSQVFVPDPQSAVGFANSAGQLVTIG